MIVLEFELYERIGPTLSWDTDPISRLFQKPCPHLVVTAEQWNSGTADSTDKRTWELFKKCRCLQQSPTHCFLLTLQHKRLDDEMAWALLLTFCNNKLSKRNKLWNSCLKTDWFHLNHPVADFVLEKWVSSLVTKFIICDFGFRGLWLWKH